MTSLSLRPTANIAPRRPEHCDCDSIEMPVSALSVIESPGVGRSVLHTTYECGDLA